MIDVVAINGISEYILRNFINSHKPKSKKKKLIDKIDIFNIFRLLTNHKISSYFDVSFIAGKEEEIKELIDEGEIDSFIKEINPFFKKPYNQNKYDFYVKYYYISKLVVEQVALLLESRQIPKWFKIIDVTNNKEVDNASLDIQSDKKLVALFRTFDEAKDKSPVFLPKTATALFSVNALSLLYFGIMPGALVAACIKAFA